MIIPRAFLVSTLGLLIGWASASLMLYVLHWSLLVVVVVNTLVGLIIGELTLPYVRKP